MFTDFLCIHCLVVGYRTSTAYGYDASHIVKGVRVLYHMNSDITIDGMSVTELALKTNVDDHSITIL
jgi:hypothetical protein